MRLIKIAGNFADQFDQQEKIDIELNDAEKTALKALVAALNTEKPPEDIQNTIYQIAKSNQVQPRDFFKILYQIILNTSRGPKIGPFHFRYRNKTSSTESYQSMHNHGSRGS